MDIIVSFRVRCVALEKSVCVLSATPKREDTDLRCVEILSSIFGVGLLHLLSADHYAL